MRILYHVIYGSCAHGMLCEESDRDERIIYNTDESVRKEHHEKTQIEHWGLRQFLTNCEKGIPFELELLYVPEKCRITPMPEALQELVDKRAFVTQQTVKTYLSCAAWKLRQSGMGHKYAYHALRLLIEAKYMLQTKQGPQVDMKQHPMLMKIKSGIMSVDKAKELYTELLGEINQLPMNLPIRADATVIENAYQKCREQ